MFPLALNKTLLPSHGIVSPIISSVASGSVEQMLKQESTKLSAKTKIGVD